MKPRICLDIRSAQTGAKNTGIGAYVRELVKQLLEMESRFDFWFLVLSNYPIPDLKLSEDRLIKIWRPRKPERWQVVYDYFILRRILKKHHIQLFHSLVPGLLRPNADIKIVTTIYDLIPSIYPDDHINSIDVKLLYDCKMRDSVASDHIVAISDVTSRDLTRIFNNINTDKITVTFLAAYTGLRRVVEMKREYLNRLGLPERYILYVGGYNKRKNIPLLLNAYSALGMKRKNFKLVLAGAAGNYGIASHVASLGLQNDVVRLTHIAEEDLSLLYSGAIFFVYPSLYEGFGLPVLEAMTCGTPVLSSNAGSLVEVAGDAALYFTPGNEDELTMLMERVLEDSILRDDMRSRGLNRASIYSWRRCAQETLTVYENVLRA